MRRLSIGIFSYSTKPRGSVVHAASLAEALARRGHDVTLYVLDKDGQGFYRSFDSGLHEQGRGPRACGVKLAFMPAGPAPSAQEALIAQRVDEVASFVTRHRPRHDVVHAEDCLVASGLLAARTNLGSALLVRTVHHVEHFESAYLEACQERSIKQAELCLSVSRATREAVLAQYGVEAKVIENGVDVRRFGGVPPEAAWALRQRLGVPEQAQLVLSIGGVEPRKNSLRALEAFVRARKARPDLCWVIAGGASIYEHADYRAEFDARLERLPERERAAIVRTGVLGDDEMPLLLKGAQVLLHPSLQEGFGLCVLEAMAAGTPVVVSHGPPFDEFLDDTCAERVDASSPVDIARGLLLALSFGARSVPVARARAREFSWERCAARHEADRSALQARTRSHAHA
jgi:glycosyltransferase-like protein